MKKIFLMAAAVCVALTGCVKNESAVQSNEPSKTKIGFGAPVVSTQTRTIIDNTVYPESGVFVASGWFTAPGASTPVLYMDGAVCTAQDNTVDGTDYKSWVPSKEGMEYYWPKVGTMYFYAYSPSGIPGANLTTEGLMLTGYALSATNNETDVLYSDKTDEIDCAIHANVQVDGENGKYYGVQVKFNHALGAVKFMAKAKAQYANTEIKIKSIVLKSKNTGDFAQRVEEGADNSSWTSTAEDTAITLFENEEVVIGTDAAAVGETKLVIPQELSETAQVAITYSITNTMVENSTYETTANLNLKDYVFNGETTAEWKRNRKHIYTITIGLDRIYFAPSVTAWDEDVTADKDIEI